MKSINFHLLLFPQAMFQFQAHRSNEDSLLWVSILACSIAGFGNICLESKILPECGVGIRETQNIWSRQTSGFDCYTASGIHQNLGMGCRIFVVGNSGIHYDPNECFCSHRESTRWALKAGFHK